MSVVETAIPHLSPDEAIRYAIQAMQGGATENLERALATIGHAGGRAIEEVLEAATCCDVVSDDFREAFHLDWVVRGFRARAEVQNDDLFVRAFRRVFPPFKGNKVVLYRGERAAEIEAGRLGLNWSARLEAARLFATGLCTTYGCDGILLRAEASPSAVITGPNQHSIWLGEMEYIVDPSMLTNIEVIASFPPSV